MPSRRFTRRTRFQALFQARRQDGDEEGSGSARGTENSEPPGGAGEAGGGQKNRLRKKSKCARFQALLQTRRQHRAEKEPEVSLLMLSASSDSGTETKAKLPKPLTSGGFPASPPSLLGLAEPQAPHLHCIGELLLPLLVPSSSCPRMEDRPSERPKRDASKKSFLSGDGNVPAKSGERRAPESNMSLRQHIPHKVIHTEIPEETRRVGGGMPGVGGDGERRKRLLENLPKVGVDKGIRRLDLTALKKYKRHFGLKTAPTSSIKEDLQAAVIRHFATQLHADEGKTEWQFIKLVNEQKAFA